jgi:hypothetical protein
MTALLSMIARPVVSKTPSAFFRLLGACGDAVARCLVRRAAIARLREVGDAELRDIGLALSQIEQAVRGLHHLSRLAEEVTMVSSILTGGCAGARQRTPEAEVVTWN